MSTIKIVQANIAELQVEFIVNAANKDLRAGSGVCGDIFAAAGLKQLQAACKEIGGCEVGHAVMTPGFNLSAKHIIHAVGPQWNGGNHGEEEQLYCCYQTAMELVRLYGGHSIAFPIISSGVFGYPKEEAWKVAVRSIQDYLRQEDSCDIDVIFAVRSKASYDMGQRILRSEEAAFEKTITHVCLYTIDGVDDLANGRARFVAEFADRKLADNYAKYMLGKNRFKDKGIAIADVRTDEKISEYLVHTVITPGGEVLNMLTRDW